MLITVLAILVGAVAVGFSRVGATIRTAALTAAALVVLHMLSGFFVGAYQGPGVGFAAAKWLGLGGAMIGPAMILSGVAVGAVRALAADRRILLVPAALIASALVIVAASILAANLIFG